MAQRDEMIISRLGHNIQKMLDLAEKHCQQKDHQSEKAKKKLQEFSKWEANTIGIFGPRGAGKTTTLYRLEELIESFDENIKDPSKQLSKDIKILEPMDCTQVPKDIEPGCAVLLYISHQLEKQSDSEEHEEFRNKLREVAEVYSYKGQGYGELCLDLSGSKGEFASYQTEGLLDRLALKDKLHNILNQFCRDNNIKAFILPLDDFDLVNQSLTIQWTNALLDDLQQPRIIFLVAADFYRLQYLLIKEEGYDDHTSRAILNKIIPPDSRLNIPKWSLEDICEYPIHEKQPTLDSYLNDYIKGLPLSKRLVLPLLPSKPRGIKSLYESFRLDHQMKEDLPFNPNSPMEDIQDLIQWIATAREETLLARAIEDTPLIEWPMILKPGAEDSDLWEENVELAKERSNKDTYPLKPFSDLFPKDTKRQKDTDKADNHQPAQMDHPPDWGFPIRQTEQRKFSLRDTQSTDIPLWTELLLEMGFKVPKGEGMEQNSLARKAIRNRLDFFNHWKPVSERQEDAYFMIGAEHPTIQSFFNSASLVPHKAGLLWLRPDEENDQHINIGWSCLLESLRGVEDPLLNGWRHRLIVSGHELIGELPELGSQKVLSIVPDEIWAMILLTEGLSRCPWLTFTRQSGWLFHAHLALTAGMVRSAYVYALVEAERLTKGQLSETQVKLIEVLRLRDPQDLVSGGENSLIKRMSTLFSDDLETKLSENNDSLSEAFKAYLNSAPYKAVVKMTQKVIRIWERKAKRRKRSS